MIDALKTLFENDAVSSEVRAQIEEAWEARIAENKHAAVSELREEFAQKYEHDKSTMVEAIDSMLSERLAEEIAEFADDRKQLAEAKAKYSVAMRDNAKLLKGFVVEQLQREIKELHTDKLKMREQNAKLEEFIVDALSNEIAEFYEDKNDLAETKVRLVREAKAHFSKVKVSFIERSTKAITETVSKGLNKEIKALKEDIDFARKNDFGRKIFEAFAAEYGISYLNESSETAKLMKVLAIKDKQLSEAKVTAKKAIQIAESTKNEKNRLVESTSRAKTVNELVGPLSKDQREIMTDLLETVQTTRLKSAFDKYLPAVINSRSPTKQKQVLSEGKEVTGNREQNSQTYNASSKADTNVIDLRRLAGL